MEIFCSAICFVFGVIFGSFMNMLIDRLPRKIPFYKGRSYCFRCNHVLMTKDLIPLFSWLFLKGHCRYCGAKIGFRSFVVEFLCGVAGVLSFLTVDYWPQMLIVFYVLLILIAIAFIDLEHMIIPNVLLIALVIAAIGSYFAFPETGIISRVIGMAVISLPMFIAALGFNAFGLGDVKYCVVCGFLLGWQKMLLAFFIAVVIGGFVAVIRLLKGQKEKMMAFGPFLSIGFGFALLYGNEIITFYLSLIGL